MDEKKVLIIFDCFGVLYGRILLPYLKKKLYEEEVASRLRLYTEPTDHGKGHFTDIAKWMENDSGVPYETTIKEWKRLIKPNKGLFEYIDNNLKGKVSIGLLSNCARGQLEFVAQKGRHPCSVAEHSLLSYQAGMTKPDIRFYEKLIKMFKVDFDEIYMVDDSETNIKVLEGTKIKGILFKKNEALFEQLDEIIKK